MAKELVITLKIEYRDKEGGGMNQGEINEAYKLFQIPEKHIPEYTNADEFTRNIRECSLLKNVEVCYASNSVPLDKGQSKQR